MGDLRTWSSDKAWTCDMLGCCGGWLAVVVVVVLFLEGPYTSSTLEWGGGLDGWMAAFGIGRVCWWERQEGERASSMSIVQGEHARVAGKVVVGEMS